MGVRKSTRDEKQQERQVIRSNGKGKGKGKDNQDGNRGLIVRDEIAKAVLNTLSKIERSRSEGISMSEVTEFGDLFDELARLCFVRLCVCNGHLRTLDNGSSAGCRNAEAGL